LDASNVSTAYLERAQALNTIAIERGQTLAQLAISWVLRQPEMTSALVGASSVAQLEDSLHALEAAPLSRDELTVIDRFAIHGTGERP
jgi:L-glyceraldehyde 3-phosphate reductase